MSSAGSNAKQVENCDVLIVGGGPAGSTCARELKRTGLDVVVMDKSSFPRDKVCAGWITPQVVQTLQIDAGEYAKDRVFQPITGFATGLVGGSEVRTRYAQPVSYGIRRCEFDHYLLQRSGARLLSGVALKTLVREGEGWLVNGSIRAPLVVGAGGHFCPVARSLGADLGHAEQVVAAQEIEFEMSPQQAEQCRLQGALPELFFCRDLKGYGWCFRKGNFLNIGLGREDNHKLHEHVAAFCDFLQAKGKIPAAALTRFKGHAYLLYGHAKRETVADGALLVGDAAGLAYVQSGEGIRPAIESALIAARVIAGAAKDYRRAALLPYQRQLEARLGAVKTGASLSDRIPEKFKQAVGQKLLANPWFARHVVLDRWFLHLQQPALATG